MQKNRIQSFFLVLAIVVLGIQAKAEEGTRILRFPDINGEKVVFVYAGDIWSVNASGGEAKRLTSHKGLELFPKISPDGQWIAFSAEYSGSRQVYLMPAEGGTPKQLTYYNDVGMMPPRGGFDNVVLDWTPDSKQVLFRANRTPFGQRNGKFYLVSIDGGLEKPLQITEGGFGVFSPDADKLCFAPISREFRTWKRYKGGRAADLWIYDLENDHSEQITEFKGTDQIPVWHENKIYFASDRDLTLNIYSYNTENGNIEQITKHSRFDVMWPSGSGGKLAYENGGYLYTLDLESGEDKQINVQINFDNPNILPYYEKVEDDIHSYAISPTGKRALFDARGDIFSVPAELGITENLTKTQGIREIYPQWSPDGKYISYISDATGEYEMYLLENKNDAKPVQITSGSAAWKYDPVWTPDSRFLVYSDRTLHLKLLNAETKEEKIVDKAVSSEIRNYSVSPDSRWITYTREGENGQSAVWVYNIEKDESYKLTDDTFNDFNPVFSKEGDYIYFLSNRNFNLEFSSFEFDYLYNNATRIYAMALRNDSPRLFPVKNDEEKVNGAGEKNGNASDKEVKVSIEPENINHRITALPLSTGNYRNLIPVEGGLLYLDNEGLHFYEIDAKKDQVIVKNAFQAMLSSNGKKILYRSRNGYGITGLQPNQEAGAGQLDLSDLEMKIDPRKEWNQIYKDGWRIFRDYFYVDNMHNVDWKEIHNRYAELLPHVSHRADLDYILSEIISETNTGHSYVNYGDFERVDRVETGLLGAKLVVDQKKGAFKIAKIYEGENWNSDRRSPLTEQGIDIDEGEYLLAIDGEPLNVSENPYKYLENKADKIVRIAVNDKPTMDGAREYKIKPIKSELNLLYLDWVDTRRKMVDEMSNGKIGYIHVPNTSIDGNRELFRGMYAYHHKEALIIDDRYNGGGFIPDVMADLLDRETLSYWHRKGLRPDKTPAVAHDGPKAMLINHYSSSGGDAFPYYFKKKGLGTLIGTRTWGGLVGMSGNASLVDGGYIAVPRFGIFDENEEWIIEGVGVYPDIKVVDKPHLTAKGEDPTVEKAVEVLLKELESKPVEQVNSPQDPDRSEWIEIPIK